MCQGGLISCEVGNTCAVKSRVKASAELWRKALKCPIGTLPRWRRSAIPLSGLGQRRSFSAAIRLRSTTWRSTRLRRADRKGARDGGQPDQFDRRARVRADLRVFDHRSRVRSHLADRQHRLSVNFWRARSAVLCIESLAQSSRPRPSVTVRTSRCSISVIATV